MIWIAILVCAAAAPFAFTHLWARRWFRVIWWLTLFMCAGMIYQGYVRPWL